MVKFLDENDLKKIVEEVGGSSYIYQTEKEKDMSKNTWIYEQDGSVVVHFASPIAKIEPNEEDILGKIWNPKLTDDDGNPKKGKDGKIKKAWTKFEAKGIVKGKEIVYGLGSDWSVQLKALSSEMLKQGILNKDLIGTKWKFKCINKQKSLWSVDYIGKEEIRTGGNNGGVKKDAFTEVKSAILSIKEKNKGKALAGIDKVDLIDAVGFYSHMNEKQIKNIWQQLITENIIREEGNKVFFD